MSIREWTDTNDALTTVCVALARLAVVRRWRPHEGPPWRSRDATSPSRRPRACPNEGQAMGTTWENFRLVGVSMDFAREFMASVLPVTPPRRISALNSSRAFRFGSRVILAI